MAHLCETKRFAGFPDSGRLAVAAAAAAAAVVVVVVVVVVRDSIWKLRRKNVRNAGNGCPT